MPIESNKTWFPGHIAKAIREIKEMSKNIDIILYLIDARIPKSSFNKEISGIVDKPLLLLINKSQLADSNQTKKWSDYYTSNGYPSLIIDSKTRTGLDQISPAIKNLLKNKLNDYYHKGYVHYQIKALVVGIPNVGKSTFINSITRTKKTKVANIPGVTRKTQWVRTMFDFDLLDTPGIVWPKIENKTFNMLSYVDSISDKTYDQIRMAESLCEDIHESSPGMLRDIYKIDEDSPKNSFIQKIGQIKMLLVSNGCTDELRTAKFILSDFRSGKIGRITLENKKDD